MSKDLEQVDWYYLPLDPQENVCMPFQNNINTRVLEKDYFVRKFDCQAMHVPGSYAVQNNRNGPVTCSGTNSCSTIKSL
jgi:hypothetical protein